MHPPPLEKHVQWWGGGGFKVWPCKSALCGESGNYLPAMPRCLQSGLDGFGSLYRWLTCPQEGGDWMSGGLDLQSSA